MYTFETTEQNNQKANDYETKALLYLLSFRDDSNNIETFAIDCFNDVTGCNNNFSILWDVQSKNVQGLNPRKIGGNLITLFHNYEHEFPFEYFIFLMPKLKEMYLQDENKEVFSLDNFQTKYHQKIKQGLKQEYERRYKFQPNNDKINDFLNRLIFVIGNKSKSEYVKNITKFKTNIMQDKFFEGIFDEIRDKQTAFKNIAIHNDSINQPSDVTITNKIFKRTDFDALIINRFIGYDLFRNLSNIPNSFVDSVIDLDAETRKDVIQNANSEIARSLFDKNNKKLFWLFFEELINTTKINLQNTSEEIYNIVLNLDINIPNDLSELTVIYLISLIKDGWQQEE